MTFSELLKQYITRLGTTYSRLAKASGLSVSAVSNYVKGEREPNYESEQTKKLIKGILVLAEEKNLDIDEQELRMAFMGTAKNGLPIEYDVYLHNLNTLLKTLEIKGSTLAKALSYDASHISKVLAGQRRPADIGKFTARVAAYVSQFYGSEQEIAAIAALMDADAKDIQNPRERCAVVTEWLGTNMSLDRNDPVSGFLDKMNTFHLDDYIQAIHFNDIKMPSVPFQLPGTKHYYGLKEMMDAELDFMKATVLSKSMKDCILYSDMPMTEMAKDSEFPKKWMFGRAMMLKKGLRMHIIHDVNRPFYEMMLGLESFIPMYMTGLISPHYLTESQGGVFNHLLYVSGAAALEGNAVSGHHAAGKYTLYKSKDDVQHFRTRAEHLLKKSKPLMEIYRSDRKEEFAERLKSLWQEGDRRVVNCSLPLYTMEETLLEQILRHNALSDADKEQIRRYRAEYLDITEKLLAENKIRLAVPLLNEEQFAQMPLTLALSELFIETDVAYRYEEYKAHLEQTKAFAEAFPNLTVEFDPEPAFRNISYTVIGSKHVIVSKNKFPTIHFVIHHRKMVQAFQSFIPPLAPPDSRRIFY